MCLANKAIKPPRGSRVKGSYLFRVGFWQFSQKYIPCADIFLHESNMSVVTINDNIDNIKQGHEGKFEAKRQNN